MIRTMTEQSTALGFFTKYKKWVLALAIWQLIPMILLVSGVLGSIVYHYVNDDTNFHPYKSYIMSGFKEGRLDGFKDHTGFNILPTAWSEYESETYKLKKKVMLEKKEYLSQFSESERGVKLAEMKLNNIKLPLQIELEQRFSNGLEFCTDYISRRVKKEKFLSDKEYQDALQDEAWKVGYAHGYSEGFTGASYNRAITSFTY